MSSQLLADVEAAVAAPIAPTFGAKFQGADLRDHSWKTRLLGLLNEHRLLVFRDQHLSRAEQVRVGSYLGRPTPGHPLVLGDPDHPEILELDGAKDGRNARWHTDMTFELRPYAATVLTPDAVPPAGGDTLWADTRGAYESLSPPVRELADRLEAVHRIAPIAYWGEPFDNTISPDTAQRILDRANSAIPIIHSVVRRHPGTGRPNLFVNPGYTSHILGFTRHESEPLLRLFYDHMTQPEHTVRHHWRAGDVVIWDNQATMHYATADYHGADRFMRRVTIRGAKPVGISGAVSRKVIDPRDGVR